MSWNEVNLDEICRPKQWTTLSIRELSESGYPVFGANGIIGYYDKYTHEEPTLLITCRGATCGTMNISLPFSYVNGNAMALDNLDTKRVDLKFLYYSLKRRKLNDTITGSAQPQITRESLKKVKISLPPLDEQKRIAAVLDKADALREKRRAAITKLDQLLQSVFLDMFGDPVSNPKGWEKVEFEKVCDTKLGKMLDEKKQAQTNQRPYLRNANVQWNYVNTTSLFEMYFDEREQQLFRLKYGDLLICEGGEVGRTAIWRDEIPECYYQKAIHRGRPKTNKATSEYLLFLMLYLSTSGGLKNHVTVATIPHLTSEKLKSLKIPLPPIDLQKRFTKEFAEIQKLKRNVLTASIKLESLFQSLQQRAFAGELFGAAGKAEPSAVAGG